MATDPQEIARRSAHALLERDEASCWFGFELVSVHEGKAEMTMTVMKHHCNGHGTLHGGVIFSLADSAFAVACNSRNQATVAQLAQVTFLAPGKAGDRLTAVAREISLTGRSGIYDVSVKKQDGTVIGEFRGHSRAIRGSLFEPVEEQGK